MSRQEGLTPARFFALWLAIGLRSFGGGPATLYLVRQQFVATTGWITPEEFTRMWALCQISPGINLFALTILIGRRLLGWQGVLSGLAGLVLPSALITVLLTAGYRHFRHSPLLHAALQGVVPATVGVGLVTCWFMLVPPLNTSIRDGKMATALAVAILVFAGASLFTGVLPVFGILAISGLAGAAHQLVTRRRATP